MIVGKVTIIGVSKDAFVGELVKMAKAEDALKRCMAASSPYTPQEVLQQLCTDSDPLVRWCVMRNSMTPKVEDSKELEFSDKANTYLLSYRSSKEKNVYWAELEMVAE